MSAGAHPYARRLAQILAQLLALTILALAFSPRVAFAQAYATDDVVWGSPHDDDLGEQLTSPGKQVELSIDLPRSAGPWAVRETTFVCDLEICEDQNTLRQFLAVAGIREGTLTDRAQLVRALNRIGRIELFESVHAHVIARGDNAVDVGFEAKGATLVRRIRIRSGPFPQETIKRRISLRSGSFWSENEIPRNRDAIIEYFERQGLYGTEVEIEAVPVARHAVDVEIHIQRGQRLTINRIHVRGNTFLTWEEISQTVLDEFNFLSSFTQSDVQEAVDAVLRRYRTAGYIQARFDRADIRVNEEQRSVDLFLEIREGQRWDIGFTGNRVFSDDALRNTLTFYETGFVDEVEIANAVREIRALYETRGHFFTQVDVSQRSLDGDARVINFRIDEGAPAEIRSINFVGATVFSREELLDRMVTSEYDLITPSGYLQRARLNDEIQQILRMYRDAGYVNTRIPRVTMVGQDGGRDLYLNIVIEEGPRTTIKGIGISGGEEVGAEQAGARHDEALRRIAARDGDAWSTARLGEDMETIKNLWAADGFGLAEVSVACVIDGRPIASCEPEPLPPECSVSLANDIDEICTRTQSGTTIIEECLTARTEPACTRAQPLTGAEVGIDFIVNPGVPTRLERVFVVGNFATRDETILQELPIERRCVEGRRRLRSGWEPAQPCPYDPAQQLAMQANLRALGVFDSVRIDAIGPDEDLDGVTLIVKIEEGQTRHFDYRVGIDVSFENAERTLLSLPNEVVYRDLNFLGRGQELRLEGRFEPPMLSPGDVRDGTFDGDAKVVFYDPRAYIFGRFRRPWEARAELSAAWSQLTPPPTPQTRTIAFDVRIRNRIRRYTGVFYELGLSVRQTAARDTTEGLIDAPFERVSILAITPKITIELRDNPLNPKRGYFGEVSVEIAEDFFGLLGTESFTRMYTRHSGYIPLGAVTLALNLRFGAAFGSLYNGFRSDRRLSLPLGERFMLGGVTSIRGFQRDSIETMGSTEPGGDIMFNTSVELRYPLIRSLDINGAVFIDAGQLAADFSDLRLDETRLTAGVGVRWIIAGLLPMLIDYGAIINRRPGEGFGRVHFNIGYTF